MCRRALRVSPGSPADVRLLPRTVAGGLRCAWLCTFYVRTRRLAPSRPCPWRRPMKTVSERPPRCTKPQTSRPSTRATGFRATLTARAWARRVGSQGHLNRRCPLNTLTPKTICEGLCGQYMYTLCLDMSMLCVGDVEFLSSSLFPVELSRPAGQGSMRCMVYLLRVRFDDSVFSRITSAGRCENNKNETLLRSSLSHMYQKPLRLTMTVHFTYAPDTAAQTAALNPRGSGRAGPLPYFVHGHVHGFTTVSKISV